MDETGRKAHVVAPSWPVDGMTGEAAADLAAFLAASDCVPVDQERLDRLRALVPAFGIAVDTGTLDDDQVAAVVDESLGYADADVTTALAAVLPTAASLPADVLADALAARLFSPTTSVPTDDAPGRHRPDLPDLPDAGSSGLLGTEPSRAPDAETEADRATHEIVRGRLAALRTTPPHRTSPVTDTTPADHAEPTDLVEPTDPSDPAEPSPVAPSCAFPSRAFPSSAVGRRASGALLLVAARPSPRARHAASPAGARSADAASPSAAGISPSPTPGPPVRGPPRSATAADRPTSSSWDAGQTITAETAGVPHPARPRQET